VLGAAANWQAHRCAAAEEGAAGAMPLKQPRILAEGWVGRGKAILPRLHH